MNFEVRRKIDERHPALEGHFPGNPIVPGVVILDEVLQAARQWLGHLRLKRVESVKFTSPLKPGRAFSIKLHREDPSRIDFECWHEDTQISSGRLAVEPEAGEA